MTVHLHGGAIPPHVHQGPTVVKTVTQEDVTPEQLGGREGAHDKIRGAPTVL